jgi:hypothetical protein
VAASLGQLGHWAQSAEPQKVGVEGQAKVEQTLNVNVSLDPALRATIDAFNQLNFDVPLTGRMDSDAAPQRCIGHM